MNLECVGQRTQIVSKKLSLHTVGLAKLCDLPQYLQENRVDVYGLAMDFYCGFKCFNELLVASNVDENLINVKKVKELMHKKNKHIISLDYFEKPGNFLRAVNSLETYMQNTDQNNEEQIALGNWSRLHINAIDSKHFVGTLVADLMAMIIARDRKFKFLDSDLLCRAVLETMLDDRYTLKYNRRELLRLIYDQGWFTTEGDQFHPEIVEKAGKLFNG